MFLPLAKNWSDETQSVLMSQKKKKGKIFKSIVNKLDSDFGLHQY